jgi:hypothetical protein
MQSVIYDKLAGIANVSPLPGQRIGTSCTIATHTADITIGIVVDHLVIRFFRRTNEYQSISTYSKPTITNLLYLRCCEMHGDLHRIDDDKIIARTMVFGEM